VNTKDGSVLQMMALTVAGLALALVVWGSLPWLNRWLRDRTTPPPTAHYAYNDFGRRKPLLPTGPRRTGHRP
jgi:hypothetical protein